MRTYRPGFLRGLKSLIALLVLAACGGGGGDGDGSPLNPACSNFISINPNSVTAGTLQSGDCTVAVLLPGSGDNSFVDLYRVTLPSSGKLTAALDSASFDAFLLLVSEDLQTLISLDDDSGGAPNARIQTDIGAGTYVVLANSFNAGETGPYSLTLTFAPDDIWQPTSSTNAPAARTGHTAVWTGTEMWVWGGHDGNGVAKNTGARFNPATNTWTPMGMSGAPSARWGHTAIWTGVEMIIWGGYSGSQVLGNGARYNPTSDSWGSLSPDDGDPSPRMNHTAVWTGSQMIIWGGFSCVACASPELATGSRYSPGLMTWTATPLDAVASARGNHTAVWTGSRMIIWGGEINPGTPSLVGTGAVYDPVANTWTATSATNAPLPTRCHSAVRAGSEMILFGGQLDTSLGCGTSSTGTGASYFPAADVWIPMAGAPVSSTLAGAPAVWTGSQLITWFENAGARYNAPTDTWNGMSTSGAPSARRGHTLVWTGSRLIVWGGDFAGPLDTGGIYNPSADTTP